jgi:hypothetical protein
LSAPENQGRGEKAAPYLPCFPRPGAWPPANYAVKTARAPGSASEKNPHPGEFRYTY